MVNNNSRLTDNSSAVLPTFWVVLKSRPPVFNINESESKNRHLTIDSQYRFFHRESVVSRIGIDPSLRLVTSSNIL